MIHFSDLKRLTATHRTELFLLTFAALFDLSFGIEKIFLWLGRPLSNFWLGIEYLSLGAIVTAMGVYNLIKDVKMDCHHAECTESPTPCGEEPIKEKE